MKSEDLQMLLKEYPMDLLEQILSEEDYLKLEQIEFLDHVEGSWNYNADGSVDVDGDVLIYRSNVHTFPVKFNKITGELKILHCPNLKDLKGCPGTVGMFICENNLELETLEGIPKSMEDVSLINLRRLKNLKTSYKWKCPKVLIGALNIENLEGISPNVKDLYIQNTEIINLTGLPSRMNCLTIRLCHQFKTTKGAPLYIKNNFNVEMCGSFEEFSDTPKKVDQLILIDNPKFDKTVEELREKIDVDYLKINGRTYNK